MGRVGASEGPSPLLTSAILARRLLPAAALAATLAAHPAAADLRWTSVRVDADLAADGTVILTEKHVLVASGSSFVASRRLDARPPAFPEPLEVVLLDPSGGERKLEQGNFLGADVYAFDGTTLSWALRPEGAPPWEAPTTLTYRLRWKAWRAMTPVWAPRPNSRPRPASSLGERLSERWHETREALKRAGPNPLRRYVLDLNVAAPGREGPIEALDYGLTGHDSWSFAGNFMFVTLERALARDEGVDVSFLFDREYGEIPSGVSHDLPAALLALSVLPVFAGVYLLGKNLLAWRRRRRPRVSAPTPLPDRPEALSPELFAALFGESAPRAPGAGTVWRRLRDAKAVVVDRQEPPNLVLRADPADLRPPEAALVGLLFGDRGSLPLAEARESSARGDRWLDETVAEAFGRELQLRVGEGERLDAPRPPERDRDVADAAPAAFVLGLVPLAFWGGPLGTRIAGGIAVLGVAAAVFFAARKTRDAGFGALSAFVPAAASLPLAAALLAFSWLDPEPRPDVLPALFLSISAILVVRAGFVGARPGAKRKPSPLRAWALEQREALRERLMRGGGEVEPAEAPWFRAAGLEASLTEPGVPEGDLEEVLGLSAGEEGEAP
ncbi:MAG: hypothetical protein ACYDBY_06805 [Thermoanaerobaculia bacterium]